MVDEKILLVTTPDDVLQDGLRIFLFDLTPEQNQLVSGSLSEVEFDRNLIAYCWRSGDSPDWLFDKLAKCRLIIFNAESREEMLVGYLASKSRSHYLGNLRTLKIVNKSVLYDVDSIKTILERNIDDE